MSLSKLLMAFIKHYSEEGIIRLQMNDVKDPQLINGNYFINTGSPHYVIFGKRYEDMDVNNEGKK